MLRAEAAISTQPYLPTCWMVQRLTPFDRSSRVYSRCYSVRLGLRSGKRPWVRALAWPTTESSLSEFRHHSLKASTIEGWSLPVGVDVSKSSDRERDSIPPGV